MVFLAIAAMPAILAIVAIFMVFAAVSAKQIVGAGFGGLGIGFNPEIEYAKSFGDLPHGTVLYDPWRLQIPTDPKSGPYNIYKKMGLFHKSILKKAFTFGSQASTLLPVYVDPDIVRITFERTPFLSLIRRVTNRGRTADYNQITALSNAAWKPDDAEMSEADDTYVRQSEDIKFLYAVGRLTGPAIAAMKAYTDAANLEVTNKTISLRLKEQQTAIQGEEAATPSDSDLYVADIDGYDGLIKQITTNTVNASAADITTDMLRTAIRNAREAGGNPNIILMQSETLQTMKESMTDYIIHGTQRIGTLEWGFQNMVFDGIPILEMPIHMPTAQGKRQALVLDMSVIEMRVLLDVMMEELAKTSDASKFMCKVYEVLICKAEQFCAKVYNEGAP